MSFKRCEKIGNFRCCSDNFPCSFTIQCKSSTEILFSISIRKTLVHNAAVHFSFLRGKWQNYLFRFFFLRRVHLCINICQSRDWCHFYHCYQHKHHRHRLRCQSMCITSNECLLSLNTLDWHRYIRESVYCDVVVMQSLTFAKQKEATRILDEIKIRTIEQINKQKKRQK